MSSHSVCGPDVQGPLLGVSKTAIKGPAVSLSGAQAPPLALMIAGRIQFLASGRLRPSAPRGFPQILPSPPVALPVAAHITAACVSAHIRAACVSRTHRGTALFTYDNVSREWWSPHHPSHCSLCTLDSEKILLINAETTDINWDCNKQTGLCDHPDYKQHELVTLGPVGLRILL